MAADTTEPACHPDVHAEVFDSLLHLRLGQEAPGNLEAALTDERSTHHIDGAFDSLNQIARPALHQCSLGRRAPAHLDCAAHIHSPFAVSDIVGLERLGGEFLHFGKGAKQFTGVKDLGDFSYTSSIDESNGLPGVISDASPEPVDQDVMVHSVKELSEIQIDDHVLARLDERPRGLDRVVCSPAWPEPVVWSLKVGSISGCST